MLWDIYNDVGDLDMAVGVDLQIPNGTQADATTAVITLKAVAEGVTQVVFRANPKPDPGLVQTTLLSDENNNSLLPLVVDSQTIIIDNTAPVIDIVSAKQGGPELIPGGTALQGVVDIQVTAADSASGLADPPGHPIVTVMPNGSAAEPADYVSQAPAGTFNYTWTVTPATPNGLTVINASAADRSGNVQQAAAKVFNVNKNQITGRVQLEGYSGTNCSITFVATGATAKTWTFTATARVTDYTLTDVPDGSTHLSVKMAWSLRRKLALSGGLNGQWTADLTGTEPVGTTPGTGNYLRGGDVNDSNSVNVLDYSAVKIRWFQPMPEAASADVNGDGVVNTLDYSILKANWFAVGDPQ